MADRIDILDQYIQSGDFQRAFAYLDLIVEPGSWRSLEGHRKVLNAMIAAGDLASAKPRIRMLLLDHSNLPWLVGQQAAVALREGDDNALEDAYRRLFELLPHNSGAVSQLISHLRAQGKFDDADRVREESLYWNNTDISQLPRWADESVGEWSRSHEMYADLLEKCVCNLIYGDPPLVGDKIAEYSEERRVLGQDIPSLAHTMIGFRRVRQLRRAVETVVHEGIKGDIVETGVWRGGACILVKGMLDSLDVNNRQVILADTFEGLPPPDSRYPQDALTTFDFHRREELSVSTAVVEENFRKYGLFDERVAFLKGLFKDTLPLIAKRPLSLLRLDGDLYSSTTDALVCLYDSVSVGGFVIVDDYGSVIDCRRAVLDFRRNRGILEQMYSIDSDAVFWRKKS